MSSTLSPAPVERLDWVWCGDCIPAGPNSVNRGQLHLGIAPGARGCVTGEGPSYTVKTPSGIRGFGDCKGAERHIKLTLGPVAPGDRGTGARAGGIRGSAPAGARAHDPISNPLKTLLTSPYKNTLFSRPLSFGTPRARTCPGQPARHGLTRPGRQARHE